jgi:choline kinase
VLADRATTAELTGPAPAAPPLDAPVQVVILAAGMGTRLGRPWPKPLTPLHDGRSILQRQLDGLRSVLGPSVDITVVVGFEAERVMRAVPDVRFAYNPDYRVTNTSQSLLRALRNTRDGGVLWLNGDVVFDPAVLETALPALRADESFVCVDTSTVADEEVKYTVDPEGWIDELSKTVVGGLATCAEQDYFERGIETAIASAGLRVRPLDISHHAAVEVDFEADLERANALFAERSHLQPVTGDPL